MSSTGVAPNSALAYYLQFSAEDSGEESADANVPTLAAQAAGSYPRKTGLSNGSGSSSVAARKPVGFGPATGVQPKAEASSKVRKTEPSSRSAAAARTTLKPAKMIGKSRYSGGGGGGGATQPAPKPARARLTAAMMQRAVAAIGALSFAGRCACPGHCCLCWRGDIKFCGAGRELLTSTLKCLDARHEAPSLSPPGAVSTGAVSMGAVPLGTMPGTAPKAPPGWLPRPPHRPKLYTVVARKIPTGHTSQQVRCCCCCCRQRYSPTIRCADSNVFLACTHPFAASRLFRASLTSS
jgi:hypothetical protein